MHRSTISDNHGRHHVRFFPCQECVEMICAPLILFYSSCCSEEADMSGNCQPGFVVDDVIANAKYPDYYMQSHSGIQGSTSLLLSRVKRGRNCDCSE